MSDASIIDEIEGHYRNYLAGGAEREWKCAGCGQIWPCLTQRLVAEVQKLRLGLDLSTEEVRRLRGKLADTPRSEVIYPAALADIPVPRALIKQLLSAVYADELADAAKGFAKLMGEAMTASPQDAARGDSLPSRRASTRESVRECITCHELLPGDAFYAFVSDGKPYTSRSCKQCKIKLGADRRKQRTRQRGGQSQLPRKTPGGMTAKGRIAYWAIYKIEHGCADCGRSDDWRVLHFDHLPGHEKLFEISYAVTRPGSFSDEEVAAEVAKCEVVCLDCHVARTVFRLGPKERPAWIHKQRPLHLAAGYPTADAMLDGLERRAEG